MQWINSDGWSLSDFALNLSISANTSLTEEQHRPFLNVTASAASKSLTLGLKTGQTVIVTNTGGTNAFTVKNVSGDSGTSLAAGKTALVVASETANGSTVLVLN